MVGLSAQGHMLAERPAQGKGKKQESALVGPGSVLGAAAFLSSTRSRAAVRAAGTCRLAAFGPQELEALLVSAPVNCKVYYVQAHALLSTWLCPGGRGVCGVVVKVSWWYVRHKPQMTTSSC